MALISATDNRFIIRIVFNRLFSRLNILKQSTGKAKQFIRHYICFTKEKPKLGWESTGVPPVQDQGEQVLRREAYDQYAAMTKDEAQRRYWTFYEAIIIQEARLKKYCLVPRCFVWQKRSKNQSQRLSYS